MPTSEKIFQNYHEWTIQGEIDLTAAAAVSTVRGDGLSATKSAVGTYVVRVKGAQGLKATQIINRKAGLHAATLGGAFHARISAIAHDTGENSDDVLVTIITSASGGAALDTTAAVTLSFEATVRNGSMSAYP